MAHSESQTGKVATAESINGIAQTVVTRMAAGYLQLDAARREIQLIVGDEDLRSGDFVEAGQGGDRLAAVIHVGLRFQQPEAVTGELRLAHIAVKLALTTKAGAGGAGDRIGKPESGVVPCLLVLRSRITETDN